MTLTPALVRWLQGDEAAPWLAELSVRPPGQAGILPALDRLRRHLPPDRAAALVETARLRQHAAAKFPQTAGRMFFSRPALEQASPAAVSAHTACRFAGQGWVADLGCGLGGDSLALAAAGPHILAVDTDPLALTLVQANAGALAPPGRLHFILADATRPAWRLPAAWADPGRRTGAGRVFAPEQLQPPLSALLALRDATPHLGIKLMPGLPHAVIPPEAEAEWISLAGELKEAVLWFGDLARAPGRRATLLPAGVEITASGARAAVQPPGGWLYEPDPAVIRAGAVGDLAVQLGLWQIDPDIAYLTGDALLPTPFARAWRILEHFPFDLKALNRRLRALDGQVVAVKKRGSPIDPEAFRRRLFSQAGGHPRVVVITRLAGKPWVVICEDVRNMIE
jgi:SAM-dependent methyltransferase